MTKPKSCPVAAFFESKMQHELTSIKGLGPKRKEALLQAGIITLEDLLNHLPKNYLFAQEPTPIAKLTPGQFCVEGIVQAAPTVSYFGGRSMVRARITDASGSLSLTWFNQPWMAKQLSKGQRVTLYGLVQRKQNSLWLTNPKVIQDKGIIPLYAPLPGLPSKVFSGFIQQALEQVQHTAKETLPKSFLEQHKLISRYAAWQAAHQPKDKEDLDKARRRLGFENLLLYQLAIRQVGSQEQSGLRIQNTEELTEQFWQKLPFNPTEAQRTTLAQIAKDMGSEKAMRRLVQGDVGSGKTAVAFGAAVCVIANGYQCALMAPTELLARQHHENAIKLLAPFGISCGLLTGSMKAAQKRQALASIQDGTWQLIIGTHALISKDVQYHNLGLAITDEQHRFGVRQRQTLADRAEHLVPHILALSATPIPRSLALVLYGDLQVSIMDELPPGRTPVKTRIVPPSNRDDLYQYIRKKALEGEQSYLVCPLIEDGEEEEQEKKSAVTLFHQLSKGPLKGIGMALTYGSQSEDEKKQAMGDFYAGSASVLVSTTVIEVGMDVPNATTMVIEDAENFGLAQLHQLRGRVGRGHKESWCFLLGEANERLNTLSSTNDGFEIAQKDLELRGPGEFLGTRQHGKMLNVFGISDMKLIEETSTCLMELENNPDNRQMHDLLSRLAKDRYRHQLNHFN